MERCIECMCPVNPTRVKSIPQYGGYLCENHSDGAVVDEEMAQKLFLQMRKNVEKTLGSSMVVNSRRLSCKLVGKETLREESCVESEDIRGFCKSRKIWPFTWHTIFIRAGMSQEHTLAVMAHEMTHAWMFENNPNDAEATAIFNEGFCEWVSYRTAAAHDAKLEMKRMLNNVASDDYRNGLRKFLKYEKKHGMAGTIKLGKTGKSI